MKSNRLEIAIMLICSLPFVLALCFHPTPETVKGVLTIDKKPVAGAVVFVIRLGVRSNITTSGQTASDGSFTLDRKVLSGDYKVIINGKVPTKFSNASSPLRYHLPSKEGLILSLSERQ